MKTTTMKIKTILAAGKVAIILLFALLFALGATSCDNQSKSNKAKEVTTAPVSVDMTSAAEDAYIFGLGPEAMYKWFHQFGVVENGINQLNYYPSFPKPGDLPGGSANNVCRSIY